MNKGLVHLYFGNGKGKTTAAVGQGIRACGRGKNILLTQFLKSFDSGEILFLESVEAFTILKDKPVKKFIHNMNEEEKQEVFKSQKSLFGSVTEEVNKGIYHLVIMDEIIDILNLGIIDYSDLKDFLTNRPPMTEVVMTGHNPREEIFELCDYVTEIKKIKHPYDKGIKGRTGIEM